MNKLKTILIISTFFIISACGHSSSDDSKVNNNQNENISQPQPQIPERTPEITTPQIKQTVDYFGRDGNLYKPKSDPEASGDGNLVVLLSSKYSKQFDSCEIKTNSGEIAQLYCINTEPWTQIPYSCFSNGNRQTWRANFKCNDVSEVKVICRLPNEEVIFTVPKGQTNWICTRFG